MTILRWDTDKSLGELTISLAYTRLQSGYIAKNTHPLKNTPLLKRIFQRVHFVLFKKSPGLRIPPPSEPRFFLWRGGILSDIARCRNTKSVIRNLLFTSRVQWHKRDLTDDEYFEEFVKRNCFYDFDIPVGLRKEYRCFSMNVSLKLYKKC